MPANKPEYARSYYERVVKPKRQAAPPQRRRGRPAKYGEDVLKVHLKFDGEMAEMIEREAKGIGYQAFFERLVQAAR